MLKPLTVDDNKLWEILKEMGIPDHLTCLLRNLHAGQEATVKTGHGTIDWFKIEKGVHQGCILSPFLFNLHAECIKQNAGLDELQAGFRKGRETRDQIANICWLKKKKKSQRIPEKHLLLFYGLYKSL